MTSTKFIFAVLTATFVGATWGQTYYDDSYYDGDLLYADQDFDDFQSSKLPKNITKRLG